MKRTIPRATFHVMYFLWWWGFTIERNRSNDMAARVWTDTDTVYANMKAVIWQRMSLSMSDPPMIHSSAAEATTMNGMKRTVISKLISARLKRNIVELFLRDLGWLRVYIQMKRLVTREKMRMIPVNTAINGPMSSSLRHHMPWHPSVEFSMLFTMVSVEEFTSIGPLSTW